MADASLEKYIQNNTLKGFDKYTEYNGSDTLSIIILKPLH